MARIEGNEKYYAGDARVNAEGVRERLVPLRVNEETIEENGFKHSELSLVKIGYRRYPCRLEWVPEEWYETYMKMEWADVKDEEREGRCLLPNGKGGYVRCAERNRCYNCKKVGSFDFDSGLPTSVEKLFEDANFDIPDHRDEMDEVEWEILSKETEDYIRKASPESAAIFRETYNMKSQSEIARQMEIPKGSMGRKMDKMHKLAQEFINIMND